MDAHSTTEAESLKLKGNTLFGSKDYEGAAKCYSEAMCLQPTEPNYPLNRCFAYLKMKRWTEADQDATVVLRLDGANIKALYRRAIARKEQRDFRGARADLFAFIDAGGDVKVAIEENILIATAEANAVMRAVDTPSCGFRLAPSPGRGMGVFATRPFSRGDLVMIESPLYTAHGSGVEDLATAIDELSEEDFERMMQLYNCQDDDSHSPAFGIHFTNALGIDSDTSVLCLQISRINHSCDPNLSFAWHAESNTARMFALRPIAAGEELFHSYRRLITFTRAERHERLAPFGFVCACRTCALPYLERVVSDKRRMELSMSWKVDQRVPVSQPARHVEANAQLVRLLRTEGLASGSDTFTADSAVVCLHHGDWDSARYWTLETYRTRVEEFGADCYERTIHDFMRKLLCNPRGLPEAGKGKKLVFKTRL
ncbi:SET domain-containing protein [Phanerochaete sordida]|uniref:SET domain-containing protein n=1 Tax=Phanerochaete sordida TaxID=48140 RepID=A0A9P3GPE6_9APHY|nr:SET domain-containing protein [Phanerochaete sordida]